MSNRKAKELLIFLLCAFRNVGCGIMACSFFRVLFNKGMIEAYAIKLQLLVLAGQIILTSLVTNKQSRRGITAWTVMPYLFKIVAAYLFMTSHNFGAIAIVSIFSLLPVTGNDSVLLQKMEIEDLSSLTGDHEPFFSGFYQKVKKISQISGALLAFLYYNQTKCRAPALFLPYVYITICIVQLFLVFTISLFPKVSKFTAPFSTFANPSQEKLECAMESFSQACLAPAFIGYFLIQRYPLQFQQICYIITISYSFSLLSPWICQLVSQWLGPKFLMLVKCFSNIFFLLLMITFVRTINVIGIIVLAIGLFFKKYDPTETYIQQNTWNMITEKQHVLSKQIGFFLGVSFNWSFFIQLPYSIFFALPLAISGLLGIKQDIVSYILMKRQQIKEALKLQPRDIETQSINALSS